MRRLLILLCVLVFAGCLEQPGPTEFSVVTGMVARDVVVDDVSFPLSEDAAKRVAFEACGLSHLAYSNGQHCCLNKCGAYWEFVDQSRGICDIKVAMVCMETADVDCLNGIRREAC